MNTESTKCLISFSTGSCQERGSSPLPGNSVAAVVQCPEYAHQGSVLWTPEDDVTLRKADSQRHRPHLSRARILQGERQPGPGSALQRHEGEFFVCVVRRLCADKLKVCVQMAKRGILLSLQFRVRNCNWSAYSFESCRNLGSWPSLKLIQSLSPQAYSLVDREVGYCQGSAFIVGLLLMQVIIQSSPHMHTNTLIHGLPASSLTCLVKNGLIYGLISFCSFCRCQKRRLSVCLLSWCKTTDYESSSNPVWLSWDSACTSLSLWSR